MTKLRVGVDGKLFGVIAVHWTLIARPLTSGESEYAGWLCGWCDGRSVSAGPLKGVLFATIGV